MAPFAWPLAANSSCFLRIYFYLIRFKIGEPGIASSERRFSALVDPGLLQPTDTISRLNFLFVQILADREIISFFH